MSYISEQQKRHYEAKRAVMQALCWTEENYAYMQYNSGLHYLALYLDGYPEAIDMLLRSRLWWAWWRNRWVERDEQWLRNMPQPRHLYSNESRVSDYYSCHDATTLVHTMRTPRPLTYRLPLQAKRRVTCA